MKRLFFGGLAALAFFALPALAGPAALHPEPQEVRLLAEARQQAGPDQRLAYLAAAVDHAMLVAEIIALDSPEERAIAMPVSAPLAAFVPAMSQRRAFSARSRHRSG